MGIRISDILRIEVHQVLGEDHDGEIRLEEFFLLGPFLHEDEQHGVVRAGTGIFASGEQGLSIVHDEGDGLGLGELFSEE